MYVHVHALLHARGSWPRSVNFDLSRAGEGGLAPRGVEVEFTRTQGIKAENSITLPFLTRTVREAF